MVKSFDQFLNESKYVAPRAPMSDMTRKTLDKLGQSFSTEEEIVRAIEFAGLKRIPPSGKERTAEYVFLVPQNAYKKRYAAYDTGYVRAIWKARWPWVGKDMEHMTPVNRAKIETTRDRLLLILKRAADLNKKNLIGDSIFQKWLKDPSQDIEQFMHDQRGAIAANKFTKK